MPVEHWVIVMLRANGDIYGVVGPFETREAANLEWIEGQSPMVPRDVSAKVRPVHQPIMYGGEALTL